MSQAELCRKIFHLTMRFDVHRVLITTSVVLYTTCWIGICSTAQAVIVIEDRFDDADRDNDGFTDDGNNTPVVTQDGIPWFSVNGLIPQGGHKPRLSVADESGTDINGNPGIGTGLALDVQTFGQNSDFGGFFGQRITLGPNLGDQLKVSFDFRILDAFYPPVLDRRTIRFGLWQDTDNQLGMASTDNDDTTPTVWGGTDGWFESCVKPVGTCGDYGVWASLQNATSLAASSQWTFLDEEVNSDISLGGNDAVDVIARADGLNGNPNASQIPVLNFMTHNITLTLERVTPDVTGQDVRIDVGVDGITFGAQPSNPTNPPDPDNEVTTMDSFDYFLLTDNSGVSKYFIDNFIVELIPGAVQTADYDNDGDVDGRDFLVWQRGGSPNGINSGDLALWQSQYGTPLAATAVAVPEPSTVFLSFFGTTLFGMLTGRRKYPSKF